MPGVARTTKTTVEYLNQTNRLTPHRGPLPVEGRGNPTTLVALRPFVGAFLARHPSPRPPDRGDVSRIRSSADCGSLSPQRGEGRGENSRNNSRMKPLNPQHKAPEDWRTPRRYRVVEGPWTARQRLGLRQSSGAFPQFDRSEVHGEESLLSPAGFMGRGVTVSSVRNVTVVLCESAQPRRQSEESSARSFPSSDRSQPGESSLPATPPSLCFATRTHSTVESKQ